MQIALQIKNQFHINKIYLASDDIQTFNNASKWESEFRICHLPQEGFSKGDYKWKSDISVELTHQMLVDMMLLSESAHFIGAQRSMFGWVATRIRIGKGIENRNDVLKCPTWIGNDTSNKYGVWNGGKPKEGECV